MQRAPDDERSNNERAILRANGDEPLLTCMPRYRQMKVDGALRDGDQLGFETKCDAALLRVR